MRPAAEIVASWVSSEDPDSYPPAGGAVLRASWAGMCPRQIAYRLQSVLLTLIESYVDEEEP